MPPKRTRSSGSSRRVRSSTASPSPKRARAGRRASPAPATFEGLPAAAKARVARFLSLDELRRLTRGHGADVTEAATFELQRRLREYRERVGSAADAERLARLLGMAPVAEAVFLGERARLRGVETWKDGILPDHRWVEARWAAKTILRTKFKGDPDIATGIDGLLIIAPLLVEPMIAREVPQKVALEKVLDYVATDNAPDTLVSMLEAYGRYQYGASEYERRRAELWPGYLTQVLEWMIWVVRIKGSTVRVLPLLKAIRERGLLNARTLVDVRSLPELYKMAEALVELMGNNAPRSLGAVQEFFARLATKDRGPDFAMRFALRERFGPEAVAWIARAGARPDHVSARRRETHAHAALWGKHGGGVTPWFDPTSREFMRKAEKFAANKKNYKGRTLLHVAPPKNRRRLVNLGVNLAAKDARGRLFFENWDTGAAPRWPSPLSLSLSPSPSRSRPRSRSRSRSRH